MIDDSFVKKKKNSRPATNLKKWKTLILFVVLVDRKHKMSSQITEGKDSVC